jgi:hypothetical protein
MGSNKQWDEDSEDHLKKGKELARVECDFEEEQRGNMEIRVVFMLLQKGTGKPKNIKISRIYAPIKNPVSPDAFFGGQETSANDCTTGRASLKI